MHGSRSAPPVLSPAERRQFRGLERGLRITDPEWFGFHHPRRVRYGRVVRWSTAVLALVLLVLGVGAGAMLLVFGGVLLAFGTITGQVSTRSGRPRARSDHGQS